MTLTPGLPRTVLVADDDAPFREVIADYLRARGCEVLRAANGLEVLLQVKHARPAAILLDLTMPRLGGIEALKWIHAFDPAVRVIVLTAETDATIHRKALDGGAALVLSKPVDFSELVAALSTTAASAPALSAPVAAGPPGATMGAPPGPAHVLVVDDDPELRMMFEDVLRARGYRVRSVADAATALRDIARADVPQVVLLDIQMEGLSGADALPAIRAVAPHTAVIMVSGTTDEEVAKRSLADGAFDYVVKPVDMAYLIQSIDTALAVHAAMA